AIVGFIKVGKSTLINALLGASILPVGVDETTYTVIRLCYGETPFLNVYRKGVTRPEEHPFGELERLSRRSSDEEMRKNQRSINYIDAHCPHPLLQRLNLIDTPGLCSGFPEEEEAEVHQNSLDFLQGIKPDAILYLLRHRMSYEDRAVLQDFL